MDQWSISDVRRRSEGMVPSDWTQPKIYGHIDHEQPSSNDIPDTSGEEWPPSKNYHMPGQQFEFVTGTHPFRNRDPEVRKLVRAHVMRGFKRQQNLRRTSDGGLSSQLAALQTDERPRGQKEQSMPTYRYDVSRTIPRLNDPLFGTFPVQMQPHLHKRLIRYLTTVPGATYPFDSLSRYNPVRAELFRYSMTDKLVFHALLYFACVTTGMIDGKEPKESVIQFDQTISLTNQKLSDTGGEITSPIISALSALAMSEVCLYFHFLSENGLQNLTNHATGFTWGLRELETPHDRP
jgi:hypothetical protein